ncbi:MAG: di-trans,poly-cis-decaprenylcistransferase [Candidatus Altiarchaeales archaeon ex4484_43]|nr:MAG: di-trans,poly-cis-decaprenylcistransferase [Candidatus Altiarchaeales archaeon ex4484_43]HDI72794.1 di-trans,poly-cis-decaprenylcistransferase [Candidatus Altiarchaeales archaeon]
MHIGIIPDGNRRYMRKKGILSLKDSYRRGIKKFYDFLDWCIDLNINEVTAYALSTENLENRSKSEIKTLLNLFSKQALSILNNERIHDNKIHINICGDKDYLLNTEKKLGNEAIKNLRRLEELTKDYDKLTLNLAIAYSGRQEIINSVKNVINSGLELNEKNIRKNLWIKSYPEVIIRTAESRLSNFLVWQSAYSEIYFVDKLWQEFEKEDLINIIDDYNSRERRFGR